MTRRARIWMVVAVLFALLNVGGVWMAALEGELLHAAIHVVLAYAAAFVAWRRCIPPCFSPSEIAVEIAEEAEAAFARRSGAAAPEGGRPRVHTGDGEPYDQMACSTASIFAAQLVGMGDSAQARRDEIAEWLASFGPLRPSTGLVFVPMIARTARVFPALGLEDVDGVLDLFAGLPGWRFRPRTAEYWRRR